MIALNDLFDYGFKIYQESNYFKFSIDSILLAEFVNYNKNDAILDMCTGNAPIPLILSSKNKYLDITAVEIQPEIYNLAQKSILYNHCNNIKLYNADIKNITPNKKFSIVICNPPYYPINNDSFVNDNKIKSIARHEIAVKLEDIIVNASRFLTMNGNFYLVHKTDRLMEVTNLLESNHFGIRKICFVFTKNGKSSDFFLIEASKCKKSNPKVYYLNIQGLTTYQNIFKELV